MPLKLALLALFAILPGCAQEVDGRVLEDSSGNPLASAELRFHKAGQRELAADLDTDGQGRFHAAGIAAGDYTVDVVKPNFITTKLTMHVPGSGLVVRLVRLAVISGSARDDHGVAIQGRTLEIGGRTKGSARIAVLTKVAGGDELRRVREQPLDDHGNFRIFDLPPGQYSIGLWWGGLDAGSGAQLYPDNAHPRIFTVGGGEDYRDISFVLPARPGYKVSGNIELPKPDFRFALALGIPELPALLIAQTLTEPDGTFRFEKIPSGNYDLFVAGPVGGYTAFDSILRNNAAGVYGRTKVQVGGQDVANVTVPVGPGRSLNVILRPHGSGPKPESCPQSATVAFDMLEPWGIMLMTRAQAGFAKEEAVRDLPPGRFRLTASGLGAGCYQVTHPVVDLAGAPDTIPIEVAAAGSIRGVLHGAANVSVSLLDSEATANQVAQTDAEGHFAFEGLAPGKYQIKAGKRWVDVEVAVGAPTQVELQQ